MKIQGIDTAITEAERFIKTAREARVRLHAYRADVDKWLKDHTLPDGSYPGKYTGACRRASLDLTRALAEMRVTNQ